MVDDVARSELAMNVLDADAHFNHEHHYVIGKIGDLIDGFRLVTVTAADNNLGSLLADLLKDLIYTLVEEVGGVRALWSVGLSADEKVVKTLHRELGKLVALIDRLSEA